MRSINPHKIPGADGKIYTATKMKVIVQDDLIDSAQFQVTLISDAGEQVAAVVIDLTAEEYRAWDAYAPDYLRGAQEISAQKLGLTLT